MKNLDYEIQDYNSNNHWSHIRNICSLAERLEPEQTLRVYAGTSNFEEGIKDLKHAANKLKQSLYGRIFGWTPLVYVRYTSVYFDISKHKQGRSAA